ncbi:MAG: PsbP-related protein [Bacteroidetes bacterium]|nr:PsbP-related protein [Bacteroidota bacterium]
MNKKILLVFLLIAVLGASAFFIWQEKLKQKAATIPSEQKTDSTQNKEVNVAVDTTALVTQDKKIIPSSTKTYSNTNLGFSFHYPAEWSKEVKDAEVVNLSGAVTSVEINFNDTKSQTTLALACRFTKGSELYQYAVSQFKSKQGWYAKDAKQIEVAGKKAIEANLLSSTDGKGNQLNTPMKLIVVDLLDKKQTGEIQLQFKTPVANTEKGIAEFNRLLSSFKFND